ncbi:hypothetical protein SLA2020_320430 [Shorea laevis]
MCLSLSDFHVVSSSSSSYNLLKTLALCIAPATVQTAKCHCALATNLQTLSPPMKLPDKSTASLWVLVNFRALKMASTSCLPHPQNWLWQGSYVFMQKKPYETANVNSALS